MKKLFTIIALLGLSGCCSQDYYLREVQGRVGMSEMQLIQTLGHPTSTYDTYYYRSLAYTKRTNYCNGIVGCQAKECTTQYVVQNGLVVNYSINGNSCCAIKPLLSYFK